MERFTLESIYSSHGGATSRTPNARPRFTRLWQSHITLQYWIHTTFVCIQYKIFAKSDMWIIGEISQMETVLLMAEDRNRVHVELERRKGRSVEVIVGTFYPINLINWAFLY